VSEISPASVSDNLNVILAQMQAGDYDSAVENIRFAIGDEFEEIIEAVSSRRRGSGQDAALSAITVEHVVLARRFIPRLRAIARTLQRAGSANSAIAEMERLISEWNL
jgi:hypothetical protein